MNYVSIKKRNDFQIVTLVLIMLSLKDPENTGGRTHLTGTGICLLVSRRQVDDKWGARGDSGRRQNLESSVWRWLATDVTGKNTVA